MEPSQPILAGLPALRERFGERFQSNAPLARYTSARVGGPADGLLEVRSADELAQAASQLWALGLPFAILGGGSNVLVSEAGFRGVVVLNKTRQVRFDEQSQPPGVWAESGANFGALARKAAQRGLGGLEWAAGIPGSVGGAVFGNAGAHGGDMAGSLLLAEILHRTDAAPRREVWALETLGFEYRSSRLKRSVGLKAQPEAVVLAARLRLEPGDPADLQARIEDYVAHRRRTQPPGASMGSMFKNPPGDYAGRLIEAAGLKGTRVGDAQISDLHANFFINLGKASAGDILTLIQRAHQAVAEKFGVRLELEIELFGDWNDGRAL
jgi:UDP-N-acetylmuramate dehydrogenase